VLLLGDSPDADNPDVLAVSRAMSAAGLQPTVIAAGTSTFSGFTASQTFGAVLVSPGILAYADMPANGQAALVTAVGQGTGMVFTEWTSYEVSRSHFQALAPLVLLHRDDAAVSRVTFTLSATAHPIWTGLPASFTSSPRMTYTIGSAINGGQAIASVGGTDQPTAPGVIVRDAADNSGRVVHVNHAASYDPGWTSDANLLLMMTNAVRWAAHCL
jgi:hypothetical protein